MTPDVKASPQSISQRTAAAAKGSRHRGQPMISLSGCITPARYQSGSILSFVVQVENQTSCLITGIRLCSTLGVSGSRFLRPLKLSPGSLCWAQGDHVTALQPTFHPDGSLETTLPALPGFCTGTLSYRTVVDHNFASFAPGARIHTAIQLPDFSARVQLSAEAAPILDLRLTKALVSPADAGAHTPLIYDLTVKNYGNIPASAQDGPVLHHTFDPRLIISSVSSRGLDWQPGTDYRYDPTTGTFETCPGALGLAAAWHTARTSGLPVIIPSAQVITVKGVLAD